MSADSGCLFGNEHKTICYGLATNAPVLNLKIAMK